VDDHVGAVEGGGQPRAGDDVHPQGAGDRRDPVPTGPKDVGKGTPEPPGRPDNCNLLAGMHVRLHAPRTIGGGADRHRRRRWFDVDSPPPRSFSQKGGLTMAKYILMLGGADLDKRSGNPALAPQLFERFAVWARGLRESGRYIDSHKLKDQTGARLTV